MVNEEISNTEELLFKILVRGKEFEHQSISKINLESSPQSERIGGQDLQDLGSKFHQPFTGE